VSLPKFNLTKLKLDFLKSGFKDQEQYFAMQAVMNKYFLLNSEKNLAKIRLVVFKNVKKTLTLIPKSDVTEPKARLL